jgi:hypothetical protein
LQTVSEGAFFYESVGLIRDWWITESKDKVKLLAIPDGLSTDFGINDADLVIHLAAPTNVEQFMRRFCCIKTSFMSWALAYASLAKGTKGVVMPPVSCRIVVDDSWRLILPLLVHIANATPEYSVIPASVVSSAQAALQDTTFMCVPPCLQQLYLGDCMNTESCSCRHYQGPKVLKKKNFFF